MVENQKFLPQHRNTLKKNNKQKVIILIPKKNHPRNKAFQRWSLKRKFVFSILSRQSELFGDFGLCKMPKQRRLFLITSESELIADHVDFLWNSNPCIAVSTQLCIHFAVKLQCILVPRAIMIRSNHWHWVLLLSRNLGPEFLHKILVWLIFFATAGDIDVT